MANHARENDRRARSVADKRSALAGAAGRHSAPSSAQHNAYRHSDQVGGTRVRDADGQWRDRTPEERRPKPKAPERLTFGEFLKRNIVYILSVVAVVVIVVLLIFGLNMFGGAQEEPPASVQDEQEYESPFDWSNLTWSNDRPAYVVGGQVKSRLGIDVADYQKEIDWDAVASDGIDFAIVRLGYRGATKGAMHEDEYFRDNIAGAKAAGLDCGVYYFSQATTIEEALMESEFVLRRLEGVSLEYPVVYDFEEVTSLGVTRTADVTDEELAAIADAFCSRVEAAGYRAMVYGNSHDLSSFDVDVLTGRDIWWAEYDVDFPSHYMNIVMWQYTSDGNVDGISTTVDMNLDLYGAL